MSAEPEKFPPLPTKGKQGTPSKSNTLKKEKNMRRGSSVAETLKGYDDQLEVGYFEIRRKDNKIRGVAQKNEIRLVWIGGIGGRKN